MQTLVNLFIKIFIMIGVGYFLRKREVISGQLKQGMNHLIMNVILPFSVIASGNSDFSSEMSQNLMEAAVFSVIYYLGAMAIGMLAVIFLIREPEKMGQKPLGWDKADEAAANVVQELPGVTRQEAIKTASFWFFAAALLLGGWKFLCGTGIATMILLLLSITTSPMKKARV